MRVDLILGLLPFEREAIDRAVAVRLAGTVVRVATPEDLILMKLVSRRPRDEEDIRGILRQRRAQLDFDYLTAAGRGAGAALGTAGVVDPLAELAGRTRR